ncbi:GNAT family N-acetyltransferase [Inhella gelatinilytica]|uniref:GNAT family N-acetyltransferase n=1 Tax=Inhella gelatinilytica TaxID=2795030 RepID=A0A931IXP9_9BURK|nr:GNAT family N-acetyltransferase [Inhella gelatinilytica]MBH9551933.1 GNAT family N-acetyltransferase [Inhella gelatinilytica]
MPIRPPNAPPSASLMRRVEDAGLNASAPPQQALVDGWLLRLSPGHAKRSRCINALQRGQLPLDILLARCRAVFEASGLPLIVRITPFTQPHNLDDELALRGWHRFDETQVLIRQDLSGAAAAPLPAGMHLLPVGPARYAEVVGHLRGNRPEEIAAHFERLAASPVPYQGHVLLDRSERLLACGQLALEEGLAGLYDIFTPPEARRRGFARLLCQALLTRAAAQGALHAYLQVSADNQPALALYAGLGFQPAYGYHYRSERPLPA